jgi:hypothetical protein
MSDTCPASIIFINLFILTIQSDQKVSQPKTPSLKMLVPLQIYASHFVERCYSVVGCLLNMEGLVSNNFCKFIS